MSRKPKFKPEITRVRLNPEQAVLACSCYKYGLRVGGDNPNAGAEFNVCSSVLAKYIKNFTFTTKYTGAS